MPPAAPAVPTQEVVDACNRYAAAQVGDKDKTKEVVTIRVPEQYRHLSPVELSQRIEALRAFIR